MAEGVYILCFLTCVTVAILLGRGYAASREKLLLWTCVGFILLSLNNAVLVVDLVLLPDYRSFAMLRGLLMLSGVCCIVGGMVFTRA